MNEIITIASGTWKNVLRMKVVYFLIFCALVLVASAVNYDVLSMGLHKELMIDVALVLNSIAALLVVISLTFEIPKELREGVASTLLAKPLGRWQAVLLQAVLFALQHSTPAGMAYALVCGLVLGMLRSRTGSVWPGMLLHTLNNLLVFAAG